MGVIFDFAKIAFGFSDRVYAEYAAKRDEHAYRKMITLLVKANKGDAAGQALVLKPIASMVNVLSPLRSVYVISNAANEALNSPALEKNHKTKPFLKFLENTAAHFINGIQDKDERLEALFSAINHFPGHKTLGFRRRDAWSMGIRPGPNPRFFDMALNEIDGIADADPARALGQYYRVFKNTAFLSQSSDTAMRHDILPEQAKRAMDGIAKTLSQTGINCLLSAIAVESLGFRLKEGWNDDYSLLSYKSGVDEFLTQVVSTEIALAGDDATKTHYARQTIGYRKTFGESYIEAIDKYLEEQRHPSGNRFARDIINDAIAGHCSLTPQDRDVRELTIRAAEAGTDLPFTRAIMKEFSIVNLTSDSDWFRPSLGNEPPEVSTTSPKAKAPRPVHA